MGLTSFPATLTMKKIIILFLVLALTACSSSNQEPDFGTGNTGTAINFATGMAPAITTRSPIISNGGLVTKEIAGVQILRDDAPVAFANGVTAKVAEATIKTESINNKNLMSVSPTQYFKVDHSDAHFMAYYPAGTLSGQVVEYEIDGSQDILTSNQDIAKFNSKKEISFQFEHQLTHVILKVEAGNAGEATAFGKLTEASIYVPVKLNLSINSQQFKLNKATPEIKGKLSFLPNNDPVELGAAQTIGELMIYPEPFQEITLAFTHKPQQTYTLDWDSAEKLLKAGTTNTITIKLNAFEIEFDASVSPWGVGNDGGEEISIGGSQ